ncbi:unnamed protein product [Blepharisma stoltei]|uniref:C2 domain-containing protein n=1 Tax=Blepharisma stoltei TaxID=1481888 RepID=A0AAU9JU60_9CILI|nr:unnamed protein product [Blepharisma stoltei]
MEIQNTEEEEALINILYEKLQEHISDSISFKKARHFLHKKHNLSLSSVESIFTFNNHPQDIHISLENFSRNFIGYFKSINVKLALAKEEYQEKKEVFNAGIEPIRLAKENIEINQYGIMKGSVLNIVVISATVKRTPYANPFVILKCEMDSFVTTQVMYNSSPEWSQSFSTEIEHGMQDVVCTVMHYDPDGSHELIGVTHISMENLRDQEYKEIEFPIFLHKENEETAGSLKLGLQWIWDATKYYESLSIKWKDETDKFHTETLLLENELKAIQNFINVL